MSDPTTAELLAARIEAESASEAALREEHERRVGLQRALERLATHGHFHREGELNACREVSPAEAEHARTRAILHAWYSAEACDALRAYGVGVPRYVFGSKAAGDEVPEVERPGDASGTSTPARHPSGASASADCSPPSPAAADLVPGEAHPIQRHSTLLIIGYDEKFQPIYGYGPAVSDVDIGSATGFQGSEGDGEARGVGSHPENSAFPEPEDLRRVLDGISYDGIIYAACVEVMSVLDVVTGRVVRLSDRIRKAITPDV